jgi:hypothetical protein
VTPLRDGMNLVAKEFVAAQDPADPGVLVLSRFAGAARQLEAALLVNPHDPDAMADALDGALRMGLEERQARWRALWAAIEHRSPLVWGRSFMAALLRATTSHPVKPSLGGLPPVIERPRPPARLLLERVGPEMEAATLAALVKPGRVLNGQPGAEGAGDRRGLSSWRHAAAIGAATPGQRLRARIHRQRSPG